MYLNGLIDLFQLLLLGIQLGKIVFIRFIQFHLEIGCLFQATTGDTVEDDVRNLAEHLVFLHVDVLG